MKSKYLLRIITTQVLLAIIYFLVAIIVLEFAVIKGNATLIWPSSGIALAALIRLGKIYVIGIFLGAFIAAVYAGNASIVWWMSALGNSIEPLLTLYLLQYLPFSKNVYHSYDYLSLLCASGVGAILSAIVGGLSLLLAQYITLEQFNEVVLHWWMADVLGIVTVTPFLLLFSYSQIQSLLKERGAEAFLLVTSATLIALIALNNWDTVNFNNNYLLMVPLVWSALRFGQVMSSIIMVEYFIISLYGLLIQKGMFAINTSIQPEQLVLWGFFLITSISIMLVSYITNERNALYQAVNSSRTETYIFCEDDVHFEFINQSALENLKTTLFAALKLTPLDIHIFQSEQQFNNALKPLQERQVSSINFETVIHRLDKSFYPAEVMVQRVEFSNRQCYLASVIDITERLEKEKNLMLGNYICELSPQAIMVTDQDAKIIRINAAFSHITGYSAENAIGKKPSFLSSGYHDKKFYQTLWGDLLNKGVWSGEIHNRQKNGELYLQNITIKAMRNAHGEVENYFAMFTDITQERKKSLHLKHLSEHDELTGLPNKLLLQQEFNYILASTKRYGNKLGLLFIDLNDFKPINDNYGHTYGDSLLQIIANKMQSCIRETDIVARIGGDEFVILVSGIESDDACGILSAKIKSLISENVVIEGISMAISTSIGRSIYPDQGTTLNELLHAADLDMYKDKEKMKSGRLLISKKN